MKFTERQMELMNDIIREYGFESKRTIWFCKMAETLTENQLLNAYVVLKAHRLAEEN